MESLVRLSVSALREAGQQCCVRIARDELTLVARVEDEGISFLTLTLPRFEKDLMVCLEEGRIGSGHFVGFRRTKGGLPAFLSGFLRLIFDESGCVRPDSIALARAVRCVRQVCLLLKKVEIECTPDRVHNAIEGYIKTDAEVPDVPGELLEEFAETAFQLFHRYLSDVSNLLYKGDWIPRHSSGALATRETYNGRFASRVWTDRLEEVVPHWDYLSVSWRDAHECPPRFISREDEPPVKVVTVPKTLKGPRIIAEEPVWMQYVQQGVMHLLADTLRERPHRSLWEEISTDTQDHNRDLARLGSIDGSLATIDLSEASDRVSLELARALFRRFPLLWQTIEACRSETARVPDGRVITLRKFASMGSSLCFPVETMVFRTIIEMGLAREGHRSRHLGGQSPVRVYGDDMIVPTHSAQTVMRLLEAFGLKVNRDKTFVRGSFRESCGADWYAGHSVSVVRVSAALPCSRRQPREFLSTVDLHNRLYDAGWFDTAAFVASVLDGIQRVPRSAPGFPGGAIWSWDSEPDVRFSQHLHRAEQKELRLRFTRPVDHLDGYGALSKFYLNLGAEPRSKDHLEKDGRPRCVGMNIGWKAARV